MFTKQEPIIIVVPFCVERAHIQWYDIQLLDDWRVAEVPDIELTEFEYGLVVEKFMVCVIGDAERALVENNYLAENNIIASTHGRFWGVYY
jgi:hypothetical protein